MGLVWHRVITTASAIALIACLVLPGPRKSISNKIKGFYNFNRQVFRQLYYDSNFIPSREETKRDINGLERELSFEFPEEQLEQEKQKEKQPEKEEYIFKNKYPVETRKRPEQKQEDSIEREEYQAPTQPKPTINLSKRKLKRYNIKIIDNYGNVLKDTSIIRVVNFDTSFTAGQNIIIDTDRKYETNLGN